MKHALRKYISPCGSALFMVVSTMAALIVLVTAMYMSVLSSRQVQYATFDQEQAYVSSSTMADTIVAAISHADSNASNDTEKAAATLVNKIADEKKFAVGDTVHTAVTGLSESSGGLLDTVDVLITRLDDEKIKGVEYLMYDIAVTAEKNGVIETTHTIIRTKKETAPIPPRINNFFTATGYLPNDVIINSGVYNSQVFFDNEFVKIGMIEGSDFNKGALDMNCPLTCAGSLELSHDNSAPVETDDPSFWVIGNDLTILERPYQFNLGGDSTAGDLETCEKRGRLMVGGNFDCTEASLGFNTGDSNKPTDLYVLGNCTLGGNMVNIHGNLYINGNLIIDSNAAEKWYNIDGKIYLNGNIICGDGVDPSRISFGNMYVTYDENGKWISGTKGSSSTDLKLLKWSDTNVPDNGYTVTEATDTINTKIGKSVYPVWKVKDTDNVVDINFCGYYTNKMQDQYNGFANDSIKNAVAKWFPSYADAVAAYEPCYVRTISSNCTIQHIYNYGENYGVPTIIFDTGAAGNTLVINLMANRDTDGDGIEDTFSWRPTQRKAMIDTSTNLPMLENAMSGKIMWNEVYDREGTSNQINIITIGDGNLVINVGDYTIKNPDGTVKAKRSIIYEATMQEFFGHYAWFMAHGGSYDPAGKSSTTNGVTTTLPFFTRGSWVDPSTAQNSVHHADSCGKKCEYEEVKLKDDKGEEYTAHKCKTHKTIVEGELEKNVCYCEGRVEKSKYAGKYTYDGKEQLPNVNIFIISSLESADIRLATPGDTAPMNNVYFGYVYAPYMTYMDMANGGGLKSVGGLIVSDYIMAGTYTYVFALPDQGITEVAGDGMDTIGNFVPASDRNWRVHGY